MKPGYKTTEFWLALVAQVLGALLGAGVFEGAGPVGQAAGIASAVLASLGYSAGRAWTKNAEAKWGAVSEAAKAPANPPKP